MAAPVRPQKAVAKQAAPKEAAPAAPPPKEPSSRRSALLPAIVVAVALLAAAFMLRGGDSAPAPAPSSSETTVADGATLHGDPEHVVALEAITLNLSDGRFLKLGLALQLDEGVEVADGASFGARALDTTIALMGEYTYRELSAPGAREAAKTALSEAVSAAYEGAVLSVYFTEFVMQ